MGRPGQALVTLQHARKIGEPPSKLFVDLARTYRMLHRPDDEQATWREFIRRDEATADLGCQNLGVLADLAGKIDEAEGHYRRCVELQPEADLYWSKLGKLLIQRRSDPDRLQRGIAALERSLQLAPLQSDTLLDLASAYRYAGRNQEALWAARHSVDVDPGNGRGYQHIGEILIAMGRKQEGKQALELFRRYRQYYQTWETLVARVRRNSQDLIAKRYLARFYERSGSLMNAADTYVEILETRPDDTDARRRLLALRHQIRQSVSL
jgi:tetratricopeptide (TPR) repeat protein